MLDSERIVLAVFGLVLSTVVYGQRPDFRNNEGSRPQSSSQSDSLVTKKLVYTYRDIADLSVAHRSLDTLLTRVHLTEEVYKTPFLKGSLGSENSVYFQPLYDNELIPGIRSGNEVFDRLTDYEMKNRIVEVNRALARIHYAKGYSIDNSNLNLGFYRKFNREILLNLQFVRISDDSQSGLQPNARSTLDMKWMQSAKNGVRRSFLRFSKSDYEETHSRGILNASTQTASVDYTKWEITLGNQMYLTDSLIAPSTIRWDASMEWKSDDFGFTDGSLTSDEREYYKYFTAADTLTSNNRLQTLAIKNHFILNRGKWSLKAGIDLGLYSRRTASGPEEYFQILPALLARRPIKRTWDWSNTVKIALAGGQGDLSVHSELNRMDGRMGQLSLALDLKLVQPTLLFQSYGINSSSTWENDLAKIKSLSVQTSYLVPGIRTKVNLQMGLWSDYVVLDESAEPIQLGNTVVHFTVRGQKHFSLLGIQTNHDVFFQYLSSELIPRPSLGYTGSYTAKLPILKKKIDLLAGVEVHYISDFEVPAYNPVVAQFYADGSGTRSNHLVVVNLTINFKIDRFMGFVKVNNATSRLGSINRFMVRDFPIYDFRIVAGFRWDLLD